MHLKILSPASALLLILSLTPFEAYRILVVFPMCSRSHNILGEGVVRHLLEAGHEVVHMTSFPTNSSNPRLKEIDVGSIYESLMKEKDKFDVFKLSNLVGKGHTGQTAFLMYFAYDFHRQFLEHEKTVKFLSNPNEKIDAVILEWFFSESIAGIPPLFEAPMIWFGSTEAHWQILRLIGDVPNPSYNVDLFSTNRPPLTLWERIGEFGTMLQKLIIVNFIVMPFEKSLYNRVYPDIAAKRGVSMPSYDDAIYNSSMMLLNSHPSIGTPFKLPQNAKYVGGYHVDNKIAHLSKDLQKIINGTKNGVIYFSMGSNLKSMDMTAEMKGSLLKLFGSLKETIIWKFEGALDNVPNNVHLVKWAPQLSLLAHPKLKLFITHGGQLSTTEAIHFGVPVIGIPVLGDQHVNMRSVVNKGFGILVSLTENLATDLREAIGEMLANQTYTRRAKDLSAVYHDRPVSPGAELVYWVEHAVRTRGSTHLRSLALIVPWYQKMYFDVMAIVLVMLIICLKLKSMFALRKKTGITIKKNN